LVGPWGGGISSAGGAVGGVRLRGDGGNLAGGSACFRTFAAFCPNSGSFRLSFSSIGLLKKGTTGGAGVFSGRAAALGGTGILLGAGLGMLARATVTGAGAGAGAGLGTAEPTAAGPTAAEPTAARSRSTRSFFDRSFLSGEASFRGEITLGIFFSIDSLALVLRMLKARMSFSRSSSTLGCSFSVSPRSDSLLEERRLTRGVIPLRVTPPRLSPFPFVFLLDLSGLDSSTSRYLSGLRRTGE